MPLNSQVILPSYTHASDSDTVTITGEPVKGDGYYGRSDGLHSVQVTITDFTGTIDVQAVLAVNPKEEDWFTVYSQTNTNETDSSIVSVVGNYVWLRGILTYTDGTVNSVLLKH